MTTVPRVPTSTIYCAKESIDIDRSVYEWAIPGMKELFHKLNQRKNISRATRRATKEKLIDSSDLELISETFTRGQFVQCTSAWQLEFRRNGLHLCVGLSCLECFHSTQDEIWTRFDIDIVDLNGQVIHTQGSENVTKFTPLNLLGDDRSNKTRCSFWETDLIPVSELLKTWDKFVPLDILHLRLRLYIYRDKPIDEASHIAEYQEPVQLCYTDSSGPKSSTPLLEGVKKLWQSKEGVDVTFNVEGQEVKAHKFVVSVQSQVLKKITSNHRTPIELKLISLQVFEQVLKYLYTQDAIDVKTSSDIKFIASVLDACNRFEIPSLARICLVRLLTNMAVENFSDTAFYIYSRVSQERSFFKHEVKRFLMVNQRELRNLELFRKRSRADKKMFLQLCFYPVHDLPLPPYTR